MTSFCHAGVAASLAVSFRLAAVCAGATASLFGCDLVIPPSGDGGTDVLCVENFDGVLVCERAEGWGYAHLLMCLEEPPEPTGFALTGPQHAEPSFSTETTQWSLTVTSAVPGRWEFLQGDVVWGVTYEVPDDVGGYLPEAGDALTAHELWCGAGEGGAALYWRITDEAGLSVLEHGHHECWDDFDVPLAVNRTASRPTCSLASDDAEYCCGARTEIMIDVAADDPLQLTSPTRTVFTRAGERWWLHARAWDVDCGPASADCSGSRAYSLLLRLEDPPP